MNRIGLIILFFALTLADCMAQNQPVLLTSSSKDPAAREIVKNVMDIRALIRQALTWADSKESINVLPVEAEPKDNIYSRLDLTKHQQNLQILRATDFFAAEFIDSYNRLVLSLDSGLQNGKYGRWSVGDLPPFQFAHGVNPWCMCQDVPYDDPRPWEFVEIDIIMLKDTSGEFYWRWGNLKENSNPDWEKFSYQFKVVKENERWKIAYLKGFDHQ